MVLKADEKMDRQAIEKYILKTYDSIAEYPWHTAPRYAVYRHEDNRKRFTYAEFKLE